MGKGNIGIGQTDLGINIGSSAPTNVNVAPSPVSTIAQQVSQFVQQLAGLTNVAEGAAKHIGEKRFADDLNKAFDAEAQNIQPERFKTARGHRFFMLRQAQKIHETFDPASLQIQEGEKVGDALIRWTQEQADAIGGGTFFRAELLKMATRTTAVHNRREAVRTDNADFQNTLEAVGNSTLSDDFDDAKATIESGLEAAQERGQPDRVIFDRVAAAGIEAARSGNIVRADEINAFLIAKGQNESASKVDRTSKAIRISDFTARIRDPRNSLEDYETLSAEIEAARKRGEITQAGEQTLFATMKAVTASVVKAQGTALIISDAEQHMLSGAWPGRTYNGSMNASFGQSTISRGTIEQNALGNIHTRMIAADPVRGNINFISDIVAPNNVVYSPYKSLLGSISTVTSEQLSKEGLPANVFQALQIAESMRGIDTATLNRHLPKGSDARNIFERYIKNVARLGTSDIGGTPAGQVSTAATSAYQEARRGFDNEQIGIGKIINFKEASFQSDVESEFNNRFSIFDLGLFDRSLQNLSYVRDRTRERVKQLMRQGNEQTESTDIALEEAKEGWEIYNDYAILNDDNTLPRLFKDKSKWWIENVWAPKQPRIDDPGLITILSEEVFPQLKKVREAKPSFFVAARGAGDAKFRINPRKDVVLWPHPTNNNLFVLIETATGSVIRDDSGEVTIPRGELEKLYETHITSDAEEATRSAVDAKDDRLKGIKAMKRLSESMLGGPTGGLTTRQIRERGI